MIRFRAWDGARPEFWNGPLSRSAARFGAGESAGLAIGGEHVLDRANRGARHLAEHVLNHGGDARKRQAPIEKRRHGDFVRGVQGARKWPAAAQCLLRKRQARKFARRHLLKIQFAERLPIERETVGSDALGESEGVLN